MISLEIPADQLDAVRVSLLELYQVCVDALNHDASRHLRTGDSLAALHRRRDELADLDRMLERVGWPGEPAIEPAVAVSASAHRLREAVWVALCRATSDLEEACRAYAPEVGGTDDLEKTLARVRRQLTMLTDIEDGESGG